MKWILYAIIFALSYFGFTYFQFIHLPIGWILLILFFALLIQLFVHEFGHLLFGLLTGYTFISFRISVFLLYKKEGKFHFTVLPDFAFLGQCLMEPPTKTNLGHFPYIWYNAGGFISNAILSLLCLIPLFFTVGALQFFWYSLAFAGLLLAVLNAIPSVDKIPNDGHNLVTMLHDDNTRQAYYIQLYVNAKVFQGYGYADLDPSVILLPSEAKITNPLVLTAKFIEYYHYLHQLNFERANEVIATLDRRKEILPYHHDLIQLERIFLLIMIGSLELAQLRLDALSIPLRRSLLASKEIDKKRMLLAMNAFLSDNAENVEQLYQQTLLASNAFHLSGVTRGERRVVDEIMRLYREKKQRIL